MKATRHHVVADASTRAAKKHFYFLFKKQSLTHRGIGERIAGKEIARGELAEFLANVARGCGESIEVWLSRNCKWFCRWYESLYNPPIIRRRGIGTEIPSEMAHSAKVTPQCHRFCNEITTPRFLRSRISSSIDWTVFVIISPPRSALGICR